MPIAGTGLAHQLRSLAMTVLGIVLSLIPPALWFAWTETMLLIIVAIGVLSAVSLVLLADSGNEDAENQKATDGTATKNVLSDESVREIHRIFPLTYHHSLTERARFRRAMEKVRLLLKSPDQSRR